MARLGRRSLKAPLLVPCMVILMLGAQVPQSQESPGGRTRLSTVEQAVLQALAANPATAPYRVTTSIRGGRLVLGGRVGTHAIHDMVVQTALGFTRALDDELVIDTTETGRALIPTTIGGLGVAVGAAGSTGGIGAFPGASAFASPPYLYPPPLFGRLDEPFYGFEPPWITYPPWWGALSQARLNQQAAFLAAESPPQQLAKPVEAHSAELESAGSPDLQQAPNGAARSVEMFLDGKGVAVLRGSVASLEERIAVGRKVLETPGVTEVVNLLDVSGPNAANANASVAAPASLPVPTPPKPGPPAPEGPDRSSPAKKPRAISAERAEATEPAKPASIEDRFHQAVRGSGAKAIDGASVRMQDGVAFLEGRVPTVVDAMHAFRAVQKTPGVRGVEDRLQFAVPAEQARNPLVDEANGNRVDVESYLDAQLRRHLGDSVALDRVTVEGRLLSVRGYVNDDQAATRAEAVLRSMAILRGFDLRCAFTRN